MSSTGYPRAQKAPPFSLAHEAQKARSDVRAPRDPLAAEPGERTVYRLRPRAADAGLSPRLRAFLDTEQQQVVAEATGRTLVLASAGSGKTRVIVGLVAHLVERGADPASILLVTFTRRAAREMTLRAQAAAGVDLAAMTSGTFHSVCQRILRRWGSLVGLPSPFTVLDREDQGELVRLSRDEVLSGRETRPSLPRPEWIAQTVGLAGESGRPLAQVIVDQNPRLVDRVDELVAIAAGYEQRKRAMGAVDYADLLIMAARLFEEHPEVRERVATTAEWLLVDELHDVNPVQAGLVEALGAAGSKVVAVADPDQSIYGWRGADPEVVSRFAAVAGTHVVHLGRNYRSSAEIVDFAQASLPAGNPWGKKLTAMRPSLGARPVVAHLSSVGDEAAFVTQRIADLITEGRDPGDIGVLYRAHHHSVDLQLALAEAGVEFELYSGSRFVESAHVKDVLAFCRLRHNPRDTLAWSRALRLGERVGERSSARAIEAIGECDDLATAVGRLESIDGPAGRGPLLDTFRRVSETDRPEEMVLHVARSEWYRDHLTSRYPNASDREADLARLAEIAARSEDVERLLADLQLAERVEVDEDTSGPARRVALSSVHQAKGLEWPVVFVLQVEAGSFPSSWALSEGRLDEEERLFYVAVTRAADELYMCRPIQAKRPWDTGANRVVINSGMGFLDRDLSGLVHEWSVR